MKFINLKDHAGRSNSISLENLKSMSLSHGHLRVKVLYSPINPADINMIEGKYIFQPDLPHVLGNEGVVKVVENFPNSRFSIGQRVICPVLSSSTWIGFWQNEFQVSEDDCIAVPSHISDIQASMLSVNPITAFLLLTEFVELKQGDWIIQNLGSSALGRWVNFLSNKMGINTISCVRNLAYKEALLQLGAKVVLEDSKGFYKCSNKYSFCKLALNGVGGRSAYDLTRALDNNAKMITYGAMSKEPVSLSNAALILKIFHL